jgi:hypothetical protein
MQRAGLDSGFLGYLPRLSARATTSPSFQGVDLRHPRGFPVGTISRVSFHAAAPHPAWHNRVLNNKPCYMPPQTDTDR